MRTTVKYQQNKRKEVVLYNSSDYDNDIEVVEERVYNFSWEHRDLSLLKKFCVIVIIIFCLSVLIISYKDQLKTLQDVGTEVDFLMTHYKKLSEDMVVIQNYYEKQLKEVSTFLTKFMNTTNDFNKGVTDELKNMCNAIKNMRASYNEVQTLVTDKLETYETDKTGKADYALETSGGSIASIRNTKFYKICSPYNIFIPSHKVNTPQAIIQPSVMPGDCWAFEGSAGTVVVQLLQKVHVTGVSLEHVPKSLYLTGHTTSAPKDFSIWGLEHVNEEHYFLFGYFTYNNTANPVQYFAVKARSEIPFLYVEMKVHSNHGHPEYTCIYRLRVHGYIEENDGNDL